MFIVFQLFIFIADLEQGFCRVSTYLHLHKYFSRVKLDFLSKR